MSTNPHPELKAPSPADIRLTAAPLPTDTGKYRVNESGPQVAEVEFETAGLTFKVSAAVTIFIQGYQRAWTEAAQFRIRFKNGGGLPATDWPRVVASTTPGPGSIPIPGYISDQKDAPDFYLDGYKQGWNAFCIMFNDW